MIRFLVLSEADITDVTLDERTWVHLDGRMDLSRWNLCVNKTFNRTESSDRIC